MFTTLIIASFILLTCIVIAVWNNYRFEGLVSTYEGDGLYCLQEFYYNKYTNNYRLEKLCTTTEQAYEIWKKMPQVMSLNDKINEIKARGI